MDFVPIFEKKFNRSDCRVWAAKYAENDLDEFERLLEQWNDITFLREYFKKNERHLKGGFWKGMSVNQAISKTYREVTILEEKLLDIEGGFQNNDLTEFSKIFHPLDNKSLKMPLPLKGKATVDDPFIRFYALKLEENQLLITGGGLKLTRTMQECPYLTKELAKIEMVKTTLNERGIILLNE